MLIAYILQREISTCRFDLFGFAINFNYVGLKTCSNHVGLFQRIRRWSRVDVNKNKAVGNVLNHVILLLETKRNRLVTLSCFLLLS